MENKNRETQWKEMKQEYKEHTMSEKQLSEMKKKIEQAKKENRRTLKRHILRNITAAAAAVAVVITVLPNTSQTVAYAMSRIPILSKWVEVVTFRDYEYSTDRHIADIEVPEVTVSIESETETDSEISERTKQTAAEINAEIQEITGQIIEEFEKYKEDEEGYQDVIIKSEVLATTEQYFTLKLICYQGAGSGYEQDFYYTINLADGERLQLKDLFADDSDYISAISENIKIQMQEQMDADEDVYYWLNDTDVPEWNFTAITDETSFYLNENNEVVIAFNEGDVAPMYMGCVQFVIPNEVLADIRK